MEVKMKTERFNWDSFFSCTNVSKEDWNKLLKKMEKAEIEFEIALWDIFYQITLKELVTLQVNLKHKLTLDCSETIIFKNVDILMEKIKNSCIR